MHPVSNNRQNPCSDKASKIIRTNQIVTRLEPPLSRPLCLAIPQSEYVSDWPGYRFDVNAPEVYKSQS